MATHFARSKTDEESETRRRDPVYCKLYDPRSSNVQHIMNNVRMKKEADHLKSMEHRPPSSYLLDFQEPSVTINTVFGEVPLGSCLAHQLRDFGRHGTKFIFISEIPQISSPKCKGFPDIAVLSESLQEFDKTIIPFICYCSLKGRYLFSKVKHMFLKKPPFFKGRVNCGRQKTKRE